MKIKIHHFFDIIRDFGIAKEFNPHPYKHSYHKVAEIVWQHPETEVEIVVGADGVCEGCIHLVETSCNDIITHRKDFTLKEEFNNYLDSRIIEVCGIDVSKKYSFKSLLQFSEEYVENMKFIYEGNDIAHTAKRKENVQKGLKIYSAKVL
ncbi:DUF1284 domain-containing protein [Maribellus comscasis]|uniref:DUF1284 domain-containing protein n=1 Tax=Maribellus comscasis TaxID=2681766 RepID=A0A6I6JWN0_9BACT|nr:DUF1284 domain-containing protein [Maribellus comscasis]QGY45540.1 DUF1284 domain-containing protein [Maribellus comscasis]